MDSGSIVVDGHRVRLNSPMDALKAGIGLVPEERSWTAPL